MGSEPNSTLRSLHLHTLVQSLGLVCFPCSLLTLALKVIQIIRNSKRMKHERRWVWMKLLVRASLFHSICFAWFVRSRTHTSEPNEWEGETKPKDSGPWDPGNEQTEKTKLLKVWTMEDEFRGETNLTSKKLSIVKSSSISMGKKAKRIKNGKIWSLQIIK